MRPEYSILCTSSAFCTVAYHSLSGARSDPLTMPFSTLFAFTCHSRSSEAGSRHKVALLVA